jgi:hypothetical protein
VRVAYASGVRVARGDVPEGSIYAIGTKGLLVGPLTYWRLGHDLRYPFESRYSRGMMELERERRRARR